MSAKDWAAEAQRVVLRWYYQGLGGMERRQYEESVVEEELEKAYQAGYVDGHAAALEERGNV